MYIVVIAWLYVALMMAIAEATNNTGTVLGAIITFVLYGVGPVGLLIYLMSTPVRKKRIKARQAQQWATAQAMASDQPDTRSEAPTDPVAPVRKEP